MAAFTASASTLTVEKGWAVVAAPNRVRHKLLTLVLSTQGGATNYVAASELGFTRLLGSGMAQKSDDAIAYLTCPSYDGTKLFFYNVENATDATRGDPVDISATVRVTVWGY